MQRYFYYIIICCFKKIHSTHMGKQNHKVYLCVKPNLRTRRVSSGSSRAWQTLFTICFSWTIFHPLWLLLSLSTYEFAEIGGELWARSSLVLFLLNNGFHLKSPRKWCNLHSAQTFAASATAADRLYKIALSASPASEWQRVVGRAALEQKTLKLFILDASLFLCIPQRAKLLKIYLRFDH